MNSFQWEEMPLKDLTRERLLFIPGFVLLTPGYASFALARKLSLILVAVIQYRHQLCVGKREPICHQSVCQQVQSGVSQNLFGGWPLNLVATFMLARG